MRDTLQHFKFNAVVITFVEQGRYRNERGGL